MQRSTVLACWTLFRLQRRTRPANLSAVLQAELDWRGNEYHN